MLNFWRVPFLARLVFRGSGWSRRRKLSAFYAGCRPTAGDLILDVGVTPHEWSVDRGCEPVENFLERSYPWPARVVGLSIDPLTGFSPLHPAVAAVRGDGCCLPFKDRAFDIVFTNAVIEHVGGPAQQSQFIAECLRVARRGLFLAAPNRWFPYDTHVGLPFLHWLPRAIWSHFVDEPALHLLSPPGLLGLFPGGAHPRRVSAWWSPSIVVFAEPD